MKLTRAVQAQNIVAGLLPYGNSHKPQIKNIATDRAKTTTATWAIEVKNLFIITDGFKCCLRNVLTI